MTGREQLTDPGSEQSVPHFHVCAGTGCVSNGSLDVVEALNKSGSAKVSITGCHGFCASGPLVRVEPEGYLCTNVRAGAVPEIVGRLHAGQLPPDAFVYRDPTTGNLFPKEHDIPFYRHQHRATLTNCGVVDPEDIRTYLAAGGYSAIEKAVSHMSPEAVIGEILKSRLRGRGGAGYPTGTKWELTRRQPGEVKYVICNGDEGDPGAFMDRSIMEGDPHAVIEGMLVAGYAIGATEGFIYVRHEYPLAVRRLKRAVEEAVARGILGEAVLGSKFSFRIQIREGAGAFVSGEETALIKSIEGERAVPVIRPPYPSERGLWGKPTNINNVETLATIPLVINRGADWYAGLGTPKSGGTKVFALTGAIQNTGLVEVPIGTSLRHIVENIGGGARPGRRIKAVQIGGPSGGCLPAEMLDTPVDYEELGATGAIMGSGGMVVADDTTCMVDLARYFLVFTQGESCGKCVPCRIGTRKMLGILTRITEGKGIPGDIERLEKVSEHVRTASLCGLGLTAPNPVITTLRYFRDEYTAHVHDRRCPAGACEALR